MRQHYIPKSYLKRFSDSEKSIYAYDKLQSKEYPASLKSVCCEDDMYSISESYIKDNQEFNENINRLSLEKDFFAEKIEPMLNESIEALDIIKEEWISGKEYYHLQFGEKKELALHLLILFFRHPLLKDSIIKDYIRIEKANIDIIKCFLAKEENNESINDIEVNIECENSVFHAQHTYMKFNELQIYADILAKNIWVFSVSEKDEFFTSDFPIIVDSHVKNVVPHCFGLAQYGGKLTFPFSPSLLLTIYDRGYFKAKEEDDCKFLIADDKEIIHNNIHRYLYAQRHVFSKNKDFSIINNIKKIKGNHIFLKPDFKTKIISGLGRY